MPEEERETDGERCARMRSHTCRRSTKNRCTVGLLVAYWASIASIDFGWMAWKVEVSMWLLWHGSLEEGLRDGEALQLDDDVGF